MSAFIKNLSDYKRDYDLVRMYKESLRDTILTVYKDVAEKDVDEFIEKLIATKLKSPEMKVLRRKHRGDKTVTKIDFLTYLNWVYNNRHILGCNFVAYANATEVEAFLAEFITMNLKMRKKVKKDGQDAGMRGDHNFATFCNLVQANFKIRINSISGALSSPYNPLYNASGHTGLTSVTRATTSYANALNERMHASNRHYFNHETIYNELAYVLHYTDEDEVRETMHEFDVDAPSIEACMEIIEDSSKEYWRSPELMESIKRLVIAMSPEQRAMFAYQLDLSALCEYGGPTMRRFYDAIFSEIEPVTDAEEVKSIMGSASDNEVSLVGAVSSSWIKGIVLKDLTDEQRQKWAGRLNTIRNIIKRYEKLFQVFFSNGFMPANIHSIPTIVRKSVVGSDTDSTIYTTQRQVKWYTGHLQNNQLSLTIGAITAFISSELTSGLLAHMSANMGIDTHNLRTIEMKPEVVSMAQINTQKAKHYAMDKSIVEGNVFTDDKVKLEIKGVGLRSSKFPKVIRDESEKFMRMVLKMPLMEEKLKPINVASIMAKLEHILSINLSIGERSLLQTERINKPVAYAKQEDDWHYKAYLFWNMVFGNKYGMIEELPTSTLKVAVNLDKKVKFASWVKSLNPYQQKQVAKFVEQTGKNTFTNILVPGDAFESGMIEEIQPVIDTRKMLGQLMKPFYTISNGLNLNILNKNLTRFWSDELSLEEAEKHIPSIYLEVEPTLPEPSKYEDEDEEDDEDEE